jgi:hypothetical protein
MIIRVEVSLYLNYYNPTVGRWEPVIEPVGFIVEICNSPLSQLRSSIYVEMNDKSDIFLINASTQFLKILMSTLKLYKTSRNPDLQEREKDLRKMSMVESVSNSFS